MLSLSNAEYEERLALLRGPLNDPYERDIRYVLKLLRSPRAPARQIRLLISGALFFRDGQPESMVSTRDCGPRKGELCFEEGPAIQFTNIRKIFSQAFDSINAHPYSYDTRSTAHAKPQPVSLRFDSGSRASFSSKDANKTHEPSPSPQQPPLKAKEGSETLVHFKTIKDMLASYFLLRDFPKELGRLEKETAARLKKLHTNNRGLIITRDAIFKLYAKNSCAVEELESSSDPEVRCGRAKLVEVDTNRFSEMIKTPKGIGCWKNLSYLQQGVFNVHAMSVKSCIFDSGR